MIRPNTILSKCTFGLLSILPNFRLLNKLSFDQTIHMVVDLLTAVYWPKHYIIKSRGATHPQFYPNVHLACCLFLPNFRLLNRLSFD